jgi:hypothetical protein
MSTKLVVFNVHSLAIQHGSHNAICHILYPVLRDLANWNVTGKLIAASCRGFGVHMSISENEREWGFGMGGSSAGHNPIGNGIRRGIVSAANNVPATMTGKRVSWCVNASPDCVDGLGRPSVMSLTQPLLLLFLGGRGARRARLFGSSTLLMPMNGGFSVFVPRCHDNLS